MDMPTLNELTANQAEVLALSFDENWLITGPPGTGKSVIAMMRLTRMLRAKGILTNDGNKVSESDEARLIVYNRVLSNYIRNCLNELEVADEFATTYHSYFRNYWKRHLASSSSDELPLLDPNEFGSYDWGEFSERFNQRGRFFKIARYFIIDEGQDLPPELYELVYGMCDHLTIFADENQSIKTNQKSKISDIAEEIMVDSYYYLTENFRNSRPIAKLAREFFPGNERHLPELPEREGDTPEIKLFANFEGNIEAIVKHSKTFGGRTGVFLPRANWAPVWAQKLKEKINEEGLEETAVYSYKSDMNWREKNAITFREKNAIYVMHYSNAKGLEFDTVYIAEMQDRQMPKLDDPMGKHWFYVLVSRACSRLIFCYSGQGKPSQIQEIERMLNKLDDDDGLAGVREPRKPSPISGGKHALLEIE